MVSRHAQNTDAVIDAPDVGVVNPVGVPAVIMLVPLLTEWNCAVAVSDPPVMITCDGTVPTPVLALLNGTATDCPPANGAV
jgi:hypothetical protein